MLPKKILGFISYFIEFLFDALELFFETRFGAWVKLIIVVGYILLVLWLAILIPQALYGFFKYGGDGTSELHYLIFLRSGE